ncbi:MAG: 5-oxoprolinase subunit PxpA [Alphaproteobacteria bacterium]|nr:5-oxoprolinase subunit PxpA [Alphaproteobacteria bacterium]
MQIDLNADMGESFGPWTMGDDAAMLDIITSANIACGFHAGDPVVMDRTVRLAAQKGVGIGAHPGFDDKRGFGRHRILGLGATEIRTMLIYQLGALQAIARSAGATVRHVKLHGALANMASENVELASQFTEATATADADLIIVAMAKTQLETAARQSGNPVAAEIFADRAYNDDGTLVDRKTKGAVLQDPQVAADRVLKALEDQAVTSVNGVEIPVNPATVCVHGDNPVAVRMADRIRTRLDQAGVQVRPMHSFIGR